MSKSKMNFNKLYFQRHYASFKQRNPMFKLQSYLKIVRKWTKDFRGRPMLLDIGCGYGRFLTIAERYFKTYGIDPSAYALNQAKTAVRHTVFEVASLESYKQKRAYDIVTAFDALEHMENVAYSLQKIHALLSRRGRFVCVVPVYDGSLGIIGGLLDRDPTHVQKLSRWKWLKLFKSQFEIIEVQGAIRYSFPGGIYFHTMSPLFWKWGQAILVVMEKYDNR